MMRLERCVDTMAFLLAVVPATVLAGCGASDDGGSPAGTGSFPAGTGGGLPAATGGTTATNGGTTGGGAGPAAGGATVAPNGGTTGSGGAVVGTGGIPPIGGAGGAGATPGTGGGVATGGTTGTPPGPGLYDPVTGKLTAPAPGDGVQISTTSFKVNPGQELFRCFHTEVPLDGEIDVSQFESSMSKGSHHFILYRADTDTSPKGTLTNSGCTLGFDQRWIYTAGSPHNTLDMPKDVAMVLNSRQKVVFDMHYINTTSEPIDAQVVLNIKFAKGNFQKAAALVSFNTGIFIPANGKQTVTGECSPGPGANFFMMSTHTHKRGVLSTITRESASGQLMGDPIVKTTDWEHPDAVVVPNGPFVTFAQGEKFQYSCSYQNDRNSLVTVGSSADANEMCMAVTYYFPASAGGSCK